MVAERRVERAGAGSLGACRTGRGQDPGGDDRDPKDRPTA
jgi:hypothetical protein